LLEALKVGSVVSGQYQIVADFCTLPKPRGGLCQCPRKTQPRLAHVGKCVIIQGRCVAWFNALPPLPKKMYFIAFL
jgi:hypothetical protein